MVVPSWLLQLEGSARPYADAARASSRHVLKWASVRTGLPVIVVAALGVVLAWRVGRRTWHIAFELALALAVLLVATRFGWIRW